jgi:hypothetical protein
VPTTERPRLLIVTGAALADVGELPAPIRSLIASASEILVLAPVRPGRLEWIASDTDRDRHEADDRLRIVMRRVGELAPGGEVAGVVGDETPLSAFADAVWRFGPDQILVALQALDHSAWKERGLSSGFARRSTSRSPFSRSIARATCLRARSTTADRLAAA